MLNLILSLAACAVVSLFVLHHPAVVALLILIVALIDLDLLGSIYFWDLDINSITTIDLVMAVGLVIDYVAHIMHYYLHQDPTVVDRDQRVINAMAEVGPSVLSGCATTFIGILPLIAAKSQIFRVRRVGRWGAERGVAPRRVAFGRPSCLAILALGSCPPSHFDPPPSPPPPGVLLDVLCT